jgi:hypothetical protein
VDVDLPDEALMAMTLDDARRLPAGTVRYAAPSASERPRRAVASVSDPSCDRSQGRPARRHVQTQDARQPEHLGRGEALVAVDELQRLLVEVGRCGRRSTSIGEQARRRVEELVAGRVRAGPAAVRSREVWQRVGRPGRTFGPLAVNRPSREPRPLLIRAISSELLRPVSSVSTVARRGTASSTSP